MEPSDDTPLAGLRLDQISTHVATLQDAERFVFRYGRSVQGYLRAVLRDPDEAAEVWQELMANLLRRGGPATWPGRGRFRDYLKVAARNAAISFLRKQMRDSAVELAADPAAPDDADRELNSEWQRCVLEKVWRELEAHERRTPGNLAYTALRVYTECPDEDSPHQAEVVAARTGRPITPEAFRKQVSRAKRLMAEFILLEVARTLGTPTADDVAAELAELGLMRFVRDYLPDDWRTQFFGSQG